MARSAKTEVLKQTLASGGYVVDPHVVAEAILRLAGFRSSSMFETFDPSNHVAARRKQQKPLTGRDFA